jgi:ubiquinone/menaquinone biosynthesis C-methylase UbiE
MNMGWRNLLRRWHPEGIPWPGSLFYNAISGTEIFLRHYALVADHIAQFCHSGRILDIGTGPARLLSALGPSLPEMELIGLDISPAMMATASRNLKKAERVGRIGLTVGSADALPFPACTFDAVVSTGSIHHWKSPVPALNETHRVLKVGGHALIYDLVRRLPPSVAKAARREFGSLWSRMLWLHSLEEPFLTPQDMEGLVSATAFRRGKTRFVGVLCCLILQKTGA